MKAIGIYHQVDLQALDLAAALRTKGADGPVVTAEMARLARELGINQRTAEKRTRAARKAWMATGSPIVDRAAELFPMAPRPDQLALHLSVLFRAYPIVYEVADHVGRAQRLGSVIRQATVRNRIARGFGDGSNVHQAVQKILQSLVSWGLLTKTSQAGVYRPPEPQGISSEAAEVLLASAIESGGRTALAVEAIAHHPALFAYRLSGWHPTEKRLLTQFVEGSGNVHVQLAWH